MSAGWTPSVETKPFAAGGHWYVVLDDSENGIGEFYGEDHAANVANVNMAAAAPDLYDALEVIADVLANPVRPGHVAYKSKADLIARADRVLAKARGEA